MKDHLEAEQLTKCGLRFFLPAGDNSDITKRVEHGGTLSPARQLPDRPGAVRERARQPGDGLGGESCRAAGSRT